MKNKIIILAYSGGLDTSIILKWLVNKGYDVICFLGDVGQKDDFKAAESKALDLGASKVHVKNLKRNLLRTTYSRHFRATHFTKDDIY